MGIHKFDPSNSRMLISRERKKILNPSKIKYLFKGNMIKICDLGCGNGFFAIPICRWLKGRGEVIGVDISDQMLKELGIRARKMGVDNLILKRSDEYTIPLSSKSMDIVFMACVLHEVKSARRFLSEAKRILKDNGKLIVIDWKRIQTPSGPPLKIRIGKRKAIDYLKGAGFKEIEELNLYPYHYVLIGKRDN